MSKLFSRRNIFLILALVILISVGIYWFGKQTPIRDLSKIRTDYPQYATFVDDTEKLLNKKVEDKDRVLYYLDLGLAWKSLADRTQEAAFYREALSTYEAGINFTNRSNTVLLNNAGNMALYLKDFETARRYFEESIRLAPGDADGYIRLANLHKDYLRSSPEIIIAIYDQGIARMPDPTILFKAKQAFVAERGLEGQK